MTIPSKSGHVKRQYHSERRRQQAALTRQDIVKAAQQLFEKDGYSATTMAAIAREAGVAVETIYRSFDGKAGLMEAVVLAAVAGGPRRAERPVTERPAIRAIAEEPDAGLKLEKFASTQPGIWFRAGPLMRALSEASTADPKLTEVLQRLESQRLERLLEFAQNLAETGDLDAETTVEQARDIIATVNSLPVHDMLVLQHGWSPEQYQAWLASTMKSTLLRRTSIDAESQ